MHIIVSVVSLSLWLHFENRSFRRTQQAFFERLAFRSVQSPNGCHLRVMLVLIFEFSTYHTSSSKRIVSMKVYTKPGTCILDITVTQTTMSKEPFFRTFRCKKCIPYQQYICETPCPSVFIQFLCNRKIAALCNKGTKIKDEGQQNVTSKRISVYNSRVTERQSLEKKYLLVIDC